MIQFYAAGIASTKGSARAFVRGGRAIITNDAGAKAKTWAGIVSSAAYEAMDGRAPLTGPVRVFIAFHLPRPKSHFTKVCMRGDAPMWCPKKPDVDKLARCALDALTGIVFGDDSQIVRLVVEKRYANAAAGAVFAIAPATAG